MCEDNQKKTAVGPPRQSLLSEWGANHGQRKRQLDESEGQEPLRLILRISNQVEDVNVGPLSKGL